MGALLSLPKVLYADQIHRDETSYVNGGDRYH